MDNLILDKKAGVFRAGNMDFGCGALSGRLVFSESGNTSLATVYADGMPIGTAALSSDAEARTEAVFPIDRTEGIREVTVTLDGSARLHSLTFSAEPAFGATDYVPTPEKKLIDLGAQDWEATDMLGRRVASVEDVRGRKKDRKVGIFYWTWRESHAHLRPVDVVDVLEKYPAAEYRKDHPITLTDQEVLAAVGENKQEDMPKHSKSGIVVKGLYDVAVHFSKCCSPVPGDEIVGFVTRGRGVSIHRTDCVNILHLSDMERVRLIEAEWQEGADKEQFGEYHAEIKIFCHDRSGLLVDITKVFTEAEINISGIHSKTSKQGIATIDVAFQTKGRGQITKIVEKIRQIESVMDVERTTG